MEEQDEKKPLGRLNLHAKSTNNEHETPQDFFDRLNAEFDFDLDAAATPENAKCDRFFTVEDDALSQTWDGRVFCNPPYGRGLGKWVEKAARETNNPESLCELVVLLIPARPDTRYWHDYILHTRSGANYGMVDSRWVEVRFIKGRLKFGSEENSAPFPSACIIYRRGHGLLPDTTDERDVDDSEGEETT